MMKKYDIIVIGGGVGGLSCGAFLAKRGKKVILLEKNQNLGGYQTTFRRKGFIFEPCLHVMVEAGPDGLLLPLFNELGIELQFIRLNPIAHFIFPDDNIFVPSQYNEYMDFLKTKFPKEVKGIEEVFILMKGIYEGLSKPSGTDALIKEYRKKVFLEILNSHIHDQRLQAIIFGYGAYFIYPPSRISATLLSAFNASAYFKGVYLPCGGVKKLVDSLAVNIEYFGGEIRKNSPVHAIMINQGKVVGVVLQSGEKICADYVVSNIDARTTFFNMVGEKYLPSNFINQINQIKPAHSAFNVFLGVKNERLHLKNSGEPIFVFSNYNLDNQFQAMLKGDIENANFCIGIPSRINPFMAPEGHDIIIIYVPVPYRIDKIDWREKKFEYTERIINLANRVIPGLKNNIVIAEAATPETLVRYTGNSDGAVGGWSFTPEVELFRPCNKTPIEGLFLAGHWTFPGPGIGNVLTSGYITASMIL